MVFYHNQPNGARILGNAMAVQRRNYQKVTSRARAKALREWNHLVVVAK